MGAARYAGFLHTIVTTAPQVTSYLIEHAPATRGDPFTDQLITAALDTRIVQPRPAFAEPLTRAEERVLKLLPTSTYPQMAAALFVSPNTVKTHLHSIYHKLGAASRTEAIERAADLRLLLRHPARSRTTPERSATGARCGRHEPELHHVKPEPGDPLNKPPKCCLVRQFGPEGRGPGFHDDLAVVECRADRRACLAWEGDLINQRSHCDASQSA